MLIKEKYEKEKVACFVSTLYTDPIMMNSLLQSILDSFTDVSQNPISLFIFIFLGVVIIALILASIFPSYRRLLVRLKLLEENELPSSMLLWFITTIIIVKLVQAFLIQPFIVDGGSMLPTFHDKEFLLVDKFSYLIGKPERGDVMIFKLYESTGDHYTGKYLIKRVIGVPGDRLVVENGVTTIYNKENPQGFVLDEPYVTHKDTTKDVDVVLDDTHYFMMGDNRAQSYDSRSWGPLKETDARGQVLFRILPLSLFSYEPGRYSYTK